MCTPKAIKLYMLMPARLITASSKINASSNNDKIATGYSKIQVLHILHFSIIYYFLQWPG